MHQNPRGPFTVCLQRTPDLFTGRKWPKASVSTVIINVFKEPYMANTADSLAVQGGRRNCLFFLIHFIRTAVSPALWFLYAFLTVCGHPQKPRMLTSCDKVFHRKKKKYVWQTMCSLFSEVIFQVNNYRVCKRHSWWGRTSSQSLVLFATSSVQETCHGL